MSPRLPRSTHVLLFKSTRPLAALFLALNLLCNPLEGADGKKLVFISWDGAPDWVVDRLLHEGKLPAVARLAREGVRAEAMIASFPSKTAVGHAALFTGCWGVTNGITGNLVPVLARSLHTVMETASGFSSLSLRAEPIYVTAAKAGLRVAVLSATQAYPPGVHMAAVEAAGTKNGTLLALSGFEGLVAPHAMLDATNLGPKKGGWTRIPPHRGTPLELTILVAETSFFGLVYDDPADPVEGYDTVLIRQESRDARRAVASVVLKPRSASETPDQWGGPFRARRGSIWGNTFFRLFELSRDAKNLSLYVRAAHAVQGSAPPKEMLSYLEAYEGFHDDNFEAYTRGKLGPTLWQGGSGEAERRVIEGVRFDVMERIRGIRYATQEWRPDVLFHYTPTIDSAGHAWVGALDPKNPGHDPALAMRIWPFYSQVLELEDHWLGAILDMTGPSTAVALVSDHGMQGVRSFFYPNAVLARAGLYAEVSFGTPDLSLTKVLSPRWGDFSLVVNGTDWKGGTVAPEERDEVLAKAAEALLAARDPFTGKPVVTAVLPAAMLGMMGLGGPAGSDLYFDVANGYYPASGPSDKIVTPSRTPAGSGEHGFLPQRREMQAIFYLSGPGIARGRTIPPIRQIDVFPTLAAYLGIPVPSTVSGHAVGGVIMP